MWITSNKSDPANIFMAKYSAELEQNLRKEAERGGCAVWVSSQNIDDIEIEYIKKELETATGEHKAQLIKRLRELCAWWDLDGLEG